jgi:hypothetical protein
MSSRALMPIALRALCRALLSEAVDVSSCSATSAAEKSGTSRKISAARCIGDRCCNAVTEAGWAANLTRPRLRRMALR